MVNDPSIVSQPYELQAQLLKVLREARLIQDRRDGWNVFIHVAELGIFAVLTAVEQIIGMQKDLALKSPTVACSCPKCNLAV